MHLQAATDTDSGFRETLDAGKGPAEEVAQFLIRFSTDVEARENFALDKQAYLSRTDLSDEAKEILLEPDSGLLLKKLHHTSAALIAVLVLETVTTDVIVL